MGFRNSKQYNNQSKEQVRAMFEFFQTSGYGNYDKEKDTLSPG